MDIAASVVAFVGIAGQLLQGVSIVYRFLSDVQDAPEEIQQLNAELNLLKIVLENMITYPKDICGSKEAFDTVGVAMGMVQNQIRKLKDLVEKYNIKSVGRRKLLWSNINVAFRKKKFAKYIARLDRARRLLEMAQSPVESRTRARQSELLLTMHRDVSILRDSHQATAAIMVQSSIANQEAMNEARVKNAASVIITEGSESTHGNGRDSREQVAVDATQRMLSNINGRGSAHLPWLTEFAMQKLMVEILKENQQIFTNIEDFPRDSNTPETTSSKSQVEHPLHTMHRGFDEMVHFTQSNDTVAPTVYHSPWIGTVRVMRKSTVKKAWNAQDQAFEAQHRMWQTYIHLKPASWLSQLGVDLRLGTTQALYASARIESAIEPLRFVIIPDKAMHALHQGDLSTVQKLLSEGKISLRDRDSKWGDSLFKIALRHFAPSFLPEQFEQDLPSNSDVVRTSLWFLSQGLATDIQGDDQLLSDLNFLINMRNEGGDVAANVSSMERLLLEMSTNAPPVLRAMKLLSFAMINPDHSRHLESIIMDLLNDDALEAELKLLGRTERERLGHGDLFLSGIERSLFHSYFERRREARHDCNEEPKNVAFESYLKRPRRLLLEMIALDQRQFNTYKDLVDYTANVLRLSNMFASILDDGFADHASTYACRHHRLDFWHDVLLSALHSKINHINKHVTSNLSIQHPLHVRLGIESGSHNSIILSARDPHASKEESSDDLWKSIESYSKCLYDSHGTAENVEDMENFTDICFVRQEGTELHFDCAITDPQFDSQGHWEAERRYWSDFDEANRRYTYKEFIEEETQAVEPPSTPTPGLLSRLVSEGASIITSIV